jgi:Fic family protein
MAFDRRTPYDNLPPLPPAVDVESKAVLKQCLAATRAFADLKGAGGLIPDQAILINAIPLQEAKLSSEIENIVTTQDELFRAEAPKVYSKELVELVFRQPCCRIAFVVDAGIVKRKTASEYLQELERIGILVSERRGREVIYRHPALIEVLTS